MEQKYKYSINKELVADYLIKDNPSQECIKEVCKIFKAVLIKYYAKYLFMEEELRQHVLTSVLSGRFRYDPSFSAYNWIYTASRIEIGNYLYRYTKEVLVEDVLPMSNASTTENPWNGIPDCVRPYARQLAGLEAKTRKLTSKQAIPLLLYIESKTDKGQQPEYPEFFEELSDDTIKRIMYSLLLKL